jgi:hypothetical protein
MNYNNRALSRDKALYYFNKIIYESIWFIEEDVFILTIDTIFNIDIKYKNSDLLCASNLIINKKKKTYDHIYKQIKINKFASHKCLSWTRQSLC